VLPPSNKRESLRTAPQHLLGVYTYSEGVPRIYLKYEIMLSQTSPWTTA